MFITSTDCLSTVCHSVPRYPLKYQSPTFVSLNGNTTAFNVSYADGTCASSIIDRVPELARLGFPNLAVRPDISYS